MNDTPKRLADAIEVLTLVRPCIGQSVPENALPNAVEFATYLLGRLNQVVEDQEIAAAGGLRNPSPRLPGPMMTVYADFTAGRLSSAELPGALENAARLLRTNF